MAIWHIVYSSLEDLEEADAKNIWLQARKYYRRMNYLKVNRALKKMSEQGWVKRRKEGNKYIYKIV